MSYTKQVWTDSTLISARLLRHVEEQYDDSISYLGSHNHDDRYYTESQADAKFFHDVSGDTQPSGLDADTVDGSHATDLMGVSLPPGAILAWSGTDGDIPDGWVLCNGANSTPDLRDRFVPGAGSSYAVGATGGSATVTPAGSGTTQGHTLTINELPSHRHVYYDKYTGSAKDAGNGWKCIGSQTDNKDRNSNTQDSGAEGACDPHTHSIAFSASGAIDNRPPYYALYFIMRSL